MNQLLNTIEIKQSNFYIYFYFCFIGNYIN